MCSGEFFQVLCAGSQQQCINVDARGQQQQNLLACSVMATNQPTTQPQGGAVATPAASSSSSSSSSSSPPPLSSSLLASSSLAAAAPAAAVEPRTQLWSLVREISARLANVPVGSELRPFADKLRRLKALNERCANYEAQLKCTYAALMKERNTYLDMLQQVHDVGDQAGWEQKNDLLGMVRTILYSDASSART